MSHRPTVAAALLSLLVASSGLVSCTSSRATARLGELRAELSEARKQAILDNLIRAREGAPFVVLRYKGLRSASESGVSATLSGGDTDRLTVDEGTVTERDTDDLGGDLTVEISDEVSLRAEIVRDRRLYEKYLALAHGPAFHTATTEPDPAEAVARTHRVERTADGKRIARWYWIEADPAGASTRPDANPVEELMLHTVAGPPGTDSPERARLLEDHERLLETIEAVEELASDELMSDPELKEAVTSGVRYYVERLKRTNEALRARSRPESEAKGH